MDFVIAWLWYLLAFLIGSAAAWLLATVAVKHTSEQEALDAMSSSRERGAADGRG